MEPVVYVDVLIVVNFIINYFLLLAAGSLAGRAVSRKRALAAALAGAFSSLVIFLPHLPPALLGAWKLAVAVVLSAIAFRWAGVGALLRDTFILFVLSFLLAGLMLAVWFQLRPAGMLVGNGVVYFGISTVTLILTVTLAYGVLLLAGRLLRREEGEGELLQVRVELFGGEVLLTGLEDTGNHLREPFSGRPAAVVSLEAVAGLLPMEVSALACCPREAASIPPAGARFIPYSDVSGHGMLLALLPQKLELTGKGGRWRVEDTYLALSPRPVGDGRYQVLLSCASAKLKIQ